MAPGIVYVLLRAVDQHVKIGRCLDRALTPRLADLRHRYGALTVLHLERVHEPHMVERLSHKALKAHRRYGEFFDVAPSVAITAVSNAATKVETTPIMATMFLPGGIRETRLMSRQEYRNYTFELRANRS